MARSSAHYRPTASGGPGREPATLLDEMEASPSGGRGEPCPAFIEQAIRERPEDFDDNLTLAVMRAE